MSSFSGGRDLNKKKNKTSTRVNLPNINLITDKVIRNLNCNSQALEQKINSVEMKARLDQIKKSIASNSTIGTKNEDSAVTFDTSAMNRQSDMSKGEPFSYIKSVLNKD